jgi:nitrite reductase/ring-hydroxylating ferredoxin subunit
MLLGEKLIAFRDSNGAVGMLPNHCPHRGASLYFGRNEEGGLRCVYHGWKFDVEGRCVDMPNEPPESDFKHKVKADGYPCVERNGLIWTYMGPRSTPPPLPDLEANMCPDAFLDIRVNQLECNWLQVMEGSMDNTHAGFLHSGSIKPEERPRGSFAQYDLLDRTGHSYTLDTDAGVVYALRRNAEPGYYLWHILEFMFPFHTLATGLLGQNKRYVSRVPMDDTHTLQYFVQAVDTEAEFQEIQARITDRGPNYAIEGEERCAELGQLPNTSDWYGRFRRIATAGNDFLIDRAAQRRNVGGIGYTGVAGAVDQDGLATTAMGPIYDRTREHIGPTDLMIIRVRQRLIQATRALAEQGITPPGVDHPEAYRHRAGGLILAADQDWYEHTKELRQAFVDRPELTTGVLGRQ